MNSKFANIIKNSKFSKKRSSSSYPPNKRSKFAAMSDISCIEVPAMPQGEPAPSDVTCDGIPAGDWLTAMCQSLGEVPAVFETSPETLPLTIDLSAETSTESHAPKAQVYNETATLQNPTTTRPGIEDESPTRKPSKTLQKWLLDDYLLVSLIQTDCKLHIRLQECSPMDKTITMSKTAVLMNIPTYVDFKEKIEFVDNIYESSSVICNNQLAIFSRRGELVLHQIFHNNEFKLKSNPLKISHYTLLKIRNLKYDIDRAIEIALIENVLPEKILEKPNVLPTPNSDLMNEFILSLQREIAHNVSKLFKCSGCKLSDPSQFNHICMTTDYKDQLCYEGTNAFLMSDVKRIVEDLKSKGILECFSKTFFKDLCYSDIESRLREVAQC